MSGEMIEEFTDSLEWARDRQTVKTKQDLSGDSRSRE